jgi:hypothetical protein
MPRVYVSEGMITSNDETLPAWALSIMGSLTDPNPSSYAEAIAFGSGMAKGPYHRARKSESERNISRCQASAPAGWMQGCVHDQERSEQQGSEYKARVVGKN